MKANGAKRLWARAEARFSWQWQKAQAAGQTIRLAVPSDPDQLLADVCRRQASGDAALSDPFWAQVWESTAGLDRYLDGRDLSGIRALELGCGTALGGIAALLRGAEVTFTDGVSDPLLLVRITLAALAADATGTSAVTESRARRAAPRCRVRRLRFGTDVLDDTSFPIILGSDICYLRSYWPQLLQTLDIHLADGGEALLSDPYRSVSDGFCDQAQARGWHVEQHHQPLESTAVRILQLTKNGRGEPCGARVGAR